MKISLKQVARFHHPKEHEKIQSEFDGIKRISVTADGTRIAILSKSVLGHNVYVFSRFGDLIDSLEEVNHNKVSMDCLEFWPDNNHLLLVGDNPRTHHPLRNLKLWGIGGKDFTFPYNGILDWILKCSLSLDRKKILAFGNEIGKGRAGDFFIIDISLQQIQRISLKESADSVTKNSFSGDGRMLALGDHHLHIFEINDNEEYIQTKAPLHTEAFHGFSYDNQTMITTPWPRVIGCSTSFRIRNVDDPEQLIQNVYKASANGLSFDGSNGFTAISYSPSGQIIVTGHVDGSIRLWETKKHECVFWNQGAHEDEVHSILFSQSENQFISANRLSAIKWEFEINDE